MTNTRMVTACLWLCLAASCHSTKAPATDGSSGPIVAADGVWTWAETAGARCANGNGTGFAVNLASSSNELLVFFEGGGACSSYLECYIAQSASYITTGYTQTTFETNVNELPALQTQFGTNRGDPNNPFRQMNIAYIPYCTGDVHAGTLTAEYPPQDGPTYHVGGINAGLYLQRLAATLPQVEHLWLAGDSAGGFGAVLNRDRATDSFPGARIDIVDDSGIAFSGFVEPASWGIQQPSGCSNCTNDFTAVLTYYSQTYPQTRIGFLSYSTDAVLPTYLGISASTFTSDLQAFVTSTAALSNLRNFVVNGTNHVVLQDPNSTSQGEAVYTWLNAQVSDDPSWSNEVSFQ